MTAGITTVWPPTGPTSIQNVIKARPYVQFQYDDEVSAFFTAYNIYAQAYVDWFNALNLPIYTTDPVQGPLLDWVAAGLYGIIRPGLPTSIGSPPEGPINSFPANALQVNGYRPGLPETFTATNDDTFRRCISWAFYKGDGKVFTPRWLKRRINRFLNGVNGTNVVNDTTFDISVAPTGFKNWEITLTTSTASQIFKAAIETGALELPFQIVWVVTLI